MRTPGLYHLLKSYVGTTLHFYFKRYQTFGHENIPDGPVIFAANHQNAFMDALVVTCATRRNPFYLARASIFKKEIDITNTCDDQTYTHIQGKGWNK